jgi:hypothetical protein
MVRIVGYCFLSALEPLLLLAHIVEHAIFVIIDLGKPLFYITKLTFFFFFFLGQTKTVSCLSVPFLEVQKAPHNMAAIFTFFNNNKVAARSRNYSRARTCSTLNNNLVKSIRRGKAGILFFFYNE